MEKDRVEREPDLEAWQLWHKLEPCTGREFGGRDGTSGSLL